MRNVLLFSDFMQTWQRDLASWVLKSSFLCWILPSCPRMPSHQGKCNVMQTLIPSGVIFPWFIVHSVTTECRNKRVLRMNGCEFSPDAELQIIRNQTTTRCEFWKRRADCVHWSHWRSFKKIIGNVFSLLVLEHFEDFCFYPLVTIPFCLPVSTCMVTILL